MHHLDKERFAGYLKANISPRRFGEGKCARHVRLAFEAAGLSPAKWPVSARNWGKTSTSFGFVAIADDDYSPELADIMQPTSSNGHGHIQGYNGANWISDFVRRQFWPGPKYREEEPAYVIYHWPS